MTHALDEVTRDRQDDDEEITVRLNCGAVLALYTDGDGLHIELQKDTSSLEFPSLATTPSHYKGGLMLFVRGTMPKHLT